MSFNPAAAIRTSIAESAFLAGLAEAKKTHENDSGYRNLTDKEIDSLKKQGNGAADWSQVKVAEAFNSDKVVGCWFAGSVKLGEFNEPVTVEKGVQLGSGVYRSDLNNVTVGNNAHVNDNRLVANVVVGPGALVMGCGSVVCTGGTQFGNGTELPIAIETGGRETPVYAEITVEVAAAIAGNRADKAMLEDVQKASEEYNAKATSDLMVIEAGAQIKNKLVKAIIAQFLIDIVYFKRKLKTCRELHPFPVELMRRHEHHWFITVCI